MLMLLTKKLSKLIHACGKYSLPKLARFLRHGVYEHLYSPRMVEEIKEKNGT